MNRHADLGPIDDGWYDLGSENTKILFFNWIREAWASGDYTLTRVRLERTGSSGPAKICVAGILGPASIRVGHTDTGRSQL